MLSELGPVAFGLRPPPPAVAALNAAANRPDAEDVALLAQETRKSLLSGLGSPPSSPHGVGAQVDLYDTVGKQAMGLLGGGRSASTLANLLGGLKGKQDFSQGLSSLESLAPPPDFPYLKPLHGSNLGNLLNTLI